jgi:hypothetical protein
VYLGIAVVQDDEVIYNVGEHATGGVERIDVLAGHGIQRDLVEDHLPLGLVDVNAKNAPISVFHGI